MSKLVCWGIQPHPLFSWFRGGTTRLMTYQSSFSLSLIHSLCPSLILRTIERQSTSDKHNWYWSMPTGRISVTIKKTKYLDKRILTWFPNTVYSYILMAWGKWGGKERGVGKCASSLKTQQSTIPVDLNLNTVQEFQLNRLLKAETWKYTYSKKGLTQNVHFYDNLELNWIEKAKVHGHSLYNQRFIHCKPSIKKHIWLCRLLRLPHTSFVLFDY